MSLSVSEVGTKAGDSILLFVYGSLKRGYRLHCYLADHEYAGPAVTISRYHLFDCNGYPALLDAEVDGHAISGEVYRLPPAAIDVLDDVEGVSEGLYSRRVVALKSPFEDQAVQAYFYRPSVAGLRQITEWPPEPAD